MSPPEIQQFLTITDAYKGCHANFNRFVDHARESLTEFPEITWSREAPASFSVWGRTYELRFAFYPAVLKGDIQLLRSNDDDPSRATVCGKLTIDEVGNIDGHEPSRMPSRVSHAALHVMRLLNEQTFR